MPLDVAAWAAGPGDDGLVCLAVEVPGR